MATISDRIIQRMKDLKVRQVDIVEATGATKGAVSKWVAGTNIPKAEFLPALSSVLKASQTWLLTGKQTKSSNNFNMQDFISKHHLDIKTESSFDTHDIQSPMIVDYEDDDQFIGIDVVEANFSCGTGESIEFHFDVINGKQPFPPTFFYKKGIDAKNVKIIKAKGDSMADFIHDGDMVGIDMSQTEIVDGEIYAFYFEGEGMIKQIFKEEGGKLTLHSLNPKYRDREVSEQNGLNFKIMGRQFWRAG